MGAPYSRIAALAGIAAAGAAGVFLLPWHVPVRGAPILSDSYALGFSNWVSVVSLLAMAAALAAISAWVAAPAPGEPRPLWREGPPDSRRWSLSVTVALVVVAVCMWGGLLLTTGGVMWGEAPFFLDRMAQLAAGYRPYADFGYGYTLAGLYGPVWLWRLLGGLGLSPLGAYLLVYGAFILLSFWFLYVFVGRYAVSDGRRALIIAAVGLPSVVGSTLGVQYELVRYLAAPVALLALHLWFTSPRPDERWQRPVGAVLIGAGGLALTLLVASPEMTVALGVATVAYLVVAARTKRRAALFLGGFYAACLLVVAVAGHSYFSLVASFVGGAFNFPVLPGPPVLYYFAAAIVVAVLLPVVLRGGGARERPLTVGLVALGATLVPAAFGRADLGHVFLNGLVVFLLAAGFLARLRPRTFVVFIVGFALVICGAEYVYLSRDAKYGYLQAVATSGRVSSAGFARLVRLLEAPAKGLNQDPAAWAAPKASTVSELPAGDGLVAMPLGVNGSDPGLLFRFADAGRLALDPVQGTGFSYHDLRRKLAALGKADVLLVPASADKLIEAAKPGTVPLEIPHDATPTNLWTLTMWPWSMHKRNAQPYLYGQLLAFIDANYRRAGSWGEYSVYVRRAVPLQ